MKIYSFPAVSQPDSKILILGTMPGVKSLQLQQYYGHAGNSFWKIMFQLFDEPISNDYEKRKQLLLDNSIALWDVLHGCQREGSSDSKIEKEVPNDFRSFFKNHPQIKFIAFNGQPAASYYSQYISLENTLEHITLPSTSPANTWKTYEEKVNDWSTIKNWLVK